MENEIQSTETASAEETPDAFAAGFDSEETSPAASGETKQVEGTEQQNITAGASGAEKETSAKPAGPAESKAKTPGSAPDKDKQTADSTPDEGLKDTEKKPRTFVLRHLDETKTVDEQEMIALAQKGLDYGRVREKYDAAKPVMELFGKFAKDSNMTVDQYVAYIRTEAKKASGMNETDAKRAVDLEDREAAVAAKEAKEAGKAAEEEQKTAERTSAEEQRKADIEAFQKKFPDAAKSPESIPPEVWDEVKGGESLVTAFALYSMRKAQSDAEALRKSAEMRQQNEKNAQRSTGSMQSSGNKDTASNPFLEGFGT